MVLDGEPTFRRLLAAHLNAAGEYEIVEYDPIAHGAPDRDFSGAGCAAVLMGHRLSANPLQGDAPDLIRRFRRVTRFPPIVFFTPAGAPRLRERAARAGAAAVLEREDFDHRRLVSAVAELVAAPTMGVPTPRLFSNARGEQGVLAAYRWIETLSEGDTTIYVVARRDDGAHVAIKVLRVPESGPREANDDLERFMAEYEIGARLQHKHIVRLHSAAVADRHAFIEMEYCERGSLRQRLSAPLDAARAKDVTAQVASALRALHGIGVCHNDVKPGNVLIRQDGSIALADFGMASAIGSPTPARIAGTPAYMSPELGHGAQHDQRSDLYSVGVMLFEMLTGRPPFAGGDPMHVVYQHANAEVPALPAPAAPLATVVARLLAKAPADRFASAEELIRCLKKI